jgi:hypothetical protein
MDKFYSIHKMKKYVTKLKKKNPVATILGKIELI